MSRGPIGLPPSNMVYSEHIPPMRQRSDASTPRSSIHNSRHISLQSRIDPYAPEPLSDERRDSLPDIPAVYAIRGRSTSLLIDPNPPLHAPIPSDPNSIKDETPSTPPLPSSPLSISTPHEMLFIALVVLAQFMCLAGLSQSIAPMTIIAATFSTTSPGSEAWFAAAYSLTVGTFILISGRIGDILGHKRIFITGYFLLGTTSAFAGFSAYTGSEIFFDICRASQGLAAALLAPNALALLGRAYPPGIKKNIVFSLFGAMAPWGFVLGAVCASLFAQLAWWPWAFWSYALAAYLLSALSLLIIPRPLSHAAQFPPHLPRPQMDYLGSILGILALTLINISINNAPLYGWSQPTVYFLLLLGVVFLVAFIYIELHSPAPILPLRALPSTVTIPLLLVAIGWASFGIWMYYSWRFLEIIRHQSPLTVSAEFVPAMVCGLLAAGATGFLLTHAPVPLALLVAMVAFFLGELITATMPVHQSYWTQMFFAVIIMPFGMDMSFPAATLLLSNHMPREHQGLAASLVNTVVNYSISLGLGLAGSVETAVNHHASDEGDVVLGMRCAWWTGVGLAAVGVLLAAGFWGRAWYREGWRVLEH